MAIDKGNLFTHSTIARMEKTWFVVNNCPSEKEGEEFPPVFYSHYTLSVLPPPSGFYGFKLGSLSDKRITLFMLF